MDENGTTLALNDKIIAAIAAAQEGYASRGQRVLLLAKKVVYSNDIHKAVFADSNSLEERLVALNVDLTVVGLVALVDPPKGDTAHTVSICRRAGIRFAMVTGVLIARTFVSSRVHFTFASLLGDFSLTALAIAQQVGIITNPLPAVKHISDLPKDTPLDQIPSFNADKEPGDPVSSLVLSGSEMMTMTESQWAQVLAVRIFPCSTGASLSFLTRFSALV
jgi:sodium/potassium-transporting ATPase subunit alpha